MTLTVDRPGEVGPGLPETPYVGLVPYREDDAPFFFGRERERKIVTANLRAARLTLLYGPSGVGKTSLLHAGVVSNLRALGDPALAVAVFSSWSDDPLPALTEEIRRAVSDALGEEVEAPAPDVPFAEALGVWTERVRRILVVLDQFEDYFLYHPDEDGDGTFFAELPRVVNEPNLRVNFVLAVREDAIAKLDRFEGHIPNLFGNYIRVDHLTRADAREAVKGPIAEYNRRQPEGAEPYAIEPALVDAVVDAAASGRLALAAGGNGALAEEAASGRVETPFLQLVMERLWRATVAEGSHRLTMQTLRELGGAQRIVENHLLEALGSLDPAEQAAAADLFRFLVSQSKTKIAHSASDLAEWTSRPEPEVAAVLDKLCRGEHGRLLRAVPPPADEPEAIRYELYHDVLGEPIFEWRRRYEHDRQRRATIKRFAVVGGVLFALVAAFAAIGIWALIQRSDANRAASSASSLGLAAAANGQLTARPNIALLLGLEAVHARSTPPAKRSMIAALVKARSSGAETVLRDAKGWLASVAFSPDGHTLAFAGRDLTIRLWDTRSHKQLGVMRGHKHKSSISPDARFVPWITTVAFSPDGHTLASAGGNDGAVRLWDSRNQKQLAVFPVGSWPSDLAFSPDGHTLAASTSNSGVEGELWLWDTRTHKRLAVLQLPVRSGSLGESSGLTSVTFSPDARTLAAGDNHGLVRLWDAHSHKQLAVLPQGSAYIDKIVFSPNGHLLATPDDAGAIGLWDTDSHKRLTVLRGRAGFVDQVAFSPDGRTLAAADRYKTVRLWDTRTYNQIAVLRGHTGIVTSVAFSSDGHTLASAAGDGTVRLWDVRKLQQPAVLQGHTGPVHAVAFSRDGKTIDSGGDTTVRLWDARSHKEIAVIPGDAGFVYAVASSPDGRMLASGGDDGRVRLWDAQSRKQLAALPGHTGHVYGLAFSADGHTLASAGGDAMVRLWDTRSHKQLAVLPGHTGEVYGVAFSPDGHTLASAGQDKTVRLWDARTHRQLATLKGHTGVIGQTGNVYSVAFSPDGRMLASGGDDGTVRLWDVSSHEQLGPPLRGHNGAVRAVAFSPNGDTLASAGDDGTVRLWDTHDSQQLAVLKGHAGTVYAVAFSPDGDSIASAGVDGTVQVWEGILWSNFDDLKRQVCNLVVGNLSRKEWQQFAAGIPYRTTCPS